MLRIEVLEHVADIGLLLPARRGPRPRTPFALPYIQLDQWPPEDVSGDLIERSLRMADVRSKQSRMASPKSRALCLPDRCASGPQEAFIDDHEFCHLHPLPEGSIHLTLPNPLRDQAVDLGWAEPHPVARVGVMPKTLVLVYAPRDPMELEIAFHLVWSSCQFARGV